MRMEIKSKIKGKKKIVLYLTNYCNVKNYQVIVYKSYSPDTYHQLKTYATTEYTKANKIFNRLQIVPN